MHNLLLVTLSQLGLEDRAWSLCILDDRTGLQPLFLYWLDLYLGLCPMGANLSGELIESRPRCGKMNLGRPFKAGKGCNPRTASRSDG